MKTVIIVVVIAIAAVVLCIAGLGIKILLKPHGEFKRHCSSMDPYTGEGGGCVCAKATNTVCKNRQAHPYQPLDVNDELMNELRINNH